MPTHDPAFTEHLRGEPPPVVEPRRRPPRRGDFPIAALLVALAAALVGATFAALSTGDFMQHLDRQVHAIHCSFLPGAAKDLAASGCRTVMMSPYSSFFRESLWGGVPVSLWALAVFAFLAYRTALVLWRGETSEGETKVLLAASVLPVAMSALFGAVSVVALDTLCKICIGIYAASALCFGGALFAYRAQRASAPREARFAPALLEGAGLVALLTVAYVVLAPKPDPRSATSGCGSLVRAEDTAGVMIPLTSSPGGAPSIEVLDPLCASCKAFDARLAASALGERLQLRGVLFPLDSACNWMVTEAVHPGACAVSEAVLCAAGVGDAPKDGAAAAAVLRWAFARQEDLRALGARDEAGLRAEIEREFPAVRGCLGGALVRSKLTKSLRWAVANAVPVLTPQLFVGDVRMCDEDTDLGLEYTLARMLSPEAERERARMRAAEPPRPAPPPPLADLQAAAPVKAPDEAMASATTPAARPANDPPSPGESQGAEPPRSPTLVEAAAREAPAEPAPDEGGDAERAEPTPEQPPSDPEAPPEGVRASGEETEP
ncbi:vitamin K epoxide reductase family protein [Anaeromyxobacter sp. Fw109-5]|uniref:vitamin K epoxide reductase/DsbA family protein n=1 Tax=Anaeromyxobacter sp. (strain Fw109-5) TaxID=404589 RepID=UPI000158A4FE|nr:vitamin K epoxide reductase family protein [Anaeromyxobacter sp. Fw109-5]ABS27036.1 Vitamin K epoxide reductase [Anaeromyxobacter sp. Fw109-5]